MASYGSSVDMDPQVIAADVSTYLYRIWTYHWVQGQFPLLTHSSPAADVSVFFRFPNSASLDNYHHHLRYLHDFRSGVPLCVESPMVVCQGYLLPESLPSTHHVFVSVCFALVLPAVMVGPSRRQAAEIVHHTRQFELPSSSRLESIDANQDYLCPARSLHNLGLR